VRSVTISVAVLAAATFLSGAGASSHLYQRYWDPEWAPNGKQIAFVDRGDVAGDLYVMNADGTRVRRLTNSTQASGNYGARTPTWSPDSKKIAFGYGYYGIVIVNVDGSALRRITNDGDMPAWSPRGRRIAFVYPDWPASSIYVMRPDGTGRQLVAEPGENRSLFGPSWSPDGQRLAFGVGTAADTEVRPGYLGIVDQYRGRVRRILRGLNPLESDWSPSGRKIAFGFDPITNDPAFKTWVGVFDLRSGKVTRLHRGFQPSWSPNGRKIVFCGRTGGIYVMNADGSRVKRLV
jgi:TolB protein